MSKIVKQCFFITKMIIALEMIVHMCMMMVDRKVGRKMREIFFTSGVVV